MSNSSKSKEASEDLKLHKLNYELGKIDMTLEGVKARMFLDSIVDFFYQNGGKNYLSLTVNDKNNNHFEITIKNCNGTDTPAEKINRLEKTISNMAKYIDSLDIDETICKPECIKPGDCVDCIIKHFERMED